MNNQQRFLATYGQLPYEKKSNVTIDSLLSDFDLNWDVEKYPIFTTINGKQISVPGKYATVRSDTNTPLGIVGNKYEVSNNDILMSIISPLLDNDELDIESAGSFDGGRLVHIMLNLPDIIRVNGDITELKLFIGTAHDGTANIRAGLTTVRVYCKNTFYVNMRNAPVKIMHSSNMKEKIEGAHKVLKMSHALIDEVNSIFQKMSQVNTSDKKINSLIYKTLKIDASKQFSELSTRSQNIVENIKSSIEHEFDGNKALRGNLYGVFNGFTAYANHGVHFRNNFDERFNKIINGSSAKLMDSAFDIISSEL